MRSASFFLLPRLETFTALCAPRVRLIQVRSRHPPDAALLRDRSGGQHDPALVSRAAPVPRWQGMPWPRSIVHPADTDAVTAAVYYLCRLRWWLQPSTHSSWCRGASWCCLICGVPGGCDQTLRAAAHHLDFSPDGARHNSRFAFRHDGNWNVVPVRNRCASNDALSSKTEVKRLVRLSFVVCCRQLDCGRAEDGGRAGAGVEAHRARYCHREARTVRNPPSFFSTFLLCLSRACLGKIMASIYTYVLILLKQGVFARTVCLVFPCARPEPVMTTRISGLWDTQTKLMRAVLRTVVH